MRQKVMVVDDHDLIRSMLCAKFRDQGFEVCDAVNGLDAVERAPEQAPDVIVLDLAMPLDEWARGRPRSEKADAPGSFNNVYQQRWPRPWSGKPTRWESLRCFQSLIRRTCLWRGSEHSWVSRLSAEFDGHRRVNHPDVRSGTTPQPDVILLMASTGIRCFLQCWRSSHPYNRRMGLRRSLRSAERAPAG